MKLIDVAKAYMALEALAEEKLPIRVSYGLARAMDKLEKPYLFYAEKEVSLLKQYPADEQKGTILRFNDPLIAAKYSEAHEELDNLDEEVELKAVELSIDQKANIGWKDLRELERLGIVNITGLEVE